jgi:hypothetical protein
MSKIPKLHHSKAKGKERQKERQQRIERLKKRKKEGLK